MVEVRSPVRKELTMAERKVVRVEMVYDDGTSRILDDADEIVRWQNMLKKQAALAFANGYQGEQIRWKFKDLYDD